MKYVAFLSGLLLLVSTTPVVADRSDAQVGATVQTSSGPVSGHPALNRTQVSEYLGIPYAQPPLGDLRFAAPQTFSSSKPLSGASYSPDCPQIGIPPIPYPNSSPTQQSIIRYFGGGEGNPQSEDCLTLNVWSKATGKGKKAVMIWFHGGRFALGNTNTKFYQGQYIADAQDVIYVTVNYRVNVFGFSGAPGVTQNTGLLDQRKAIEWVRDNIDGFGGDPKQITILGQSAGGSAVDMYAYAYQEDPIVAGIISHSGTALSFVPSTLDYAQSRFLELANGLGCTGGDVVACMRSKDWHDIENATSKLKPAPTTALYSPVFQPVVDNKTVFSFSDYQAMSAAGKFAKVPYLAGNTNYECGFYKLSAFVTKITLTENQWTNFNLAGFTCPTGTEVTARIQAGVSAYRYRYFGEFPNLVLYSGSGAYHGSDLHMIMGGAQDVTGINNTNMENFTMQYMMRAWATFARDPAKGLSKVLNWPLYLENNNSLVRLGLNGDPAASFVSPDIYDGGCAALGRTPAAGAGAF